MKLPPLHNFRDAALAQLAMTHRSFGTPHNERLEWLGDAIMQCEVSRLLYQHFPLLSEGGLSAVRVRLVSGQALAALARRLGLGDCARLGAAEMQRGRDNDKLLAGLTESYIAAVHLDGGDVCALLTELLQEDICILAKQVQQNGIRALADGKTRLQELLQQRGEPLPKYQLVRQTGKNNAPVFTVECHAGAVRALGGGGSRAAAEQAAAAACLDLLSASDEVR